MGQLSWIEFIYWASAIVGGTLLLLRILMMLVGHGFDEVDSDAFSDLHTDLADADSGDLHHHEAPAGLKLFSLHGLTAFFMMFGLVGLALLKAGVNPILTIFGGLAAGLLTMLIISFLFLQAGRLQAEGTINIQNAIGQTGTVYLTIQPGAAGQVQVVVQGALKIFDAIAEEQGQKIATGERVRVTAVSDSKTLVVAKA